MESLEIVRGRLIDKIQVAKNRVLLEAINSILESTQSEEVLYLSPDQIEILRISENDIAAGNLISDVELAKQDKEWLG